MYNVNIITVTFIGETMFEAIEVRRVENGFVLTITTEDGVKEYVYDTSRKAIKVLKEYMEAKTNQA